MSGHAGQGDSAQALDEVRVEIDLSAVWMASRGVLQEQVNVSKLDVPWR